MLPALGVIPRQSLADDWGVYSIVPASAPALVLRGLGSGKEERVTIGKPSGGANQKWTITPKDPTHVTIHPASDPTLVLSAAEGPLKNGTAIVLETDKNQPRQQWELRKASGGRYYVLPRHADGFALDDLAGNQTPGTPVDLWEFKDGDEHLQWMIKPLAGTPAPAVDASPEPAPYVPPDIKPEAILKGEVKLTAFASSTVFPGTTRDVAVFIPAQYDGSKPACVYVKTDGYNGQEKALLETLIATKEMPITIGVFVTPGNVPANVKGTLGRRNRDFEYDGVSDNNARFLVDELLPFVATQFSLKLSTSGNDRCIAGGSSGGIAAFAAAWQRPDAFSRVYANSGSFVAFRGGQEFPTLVRKFEAKPIRAYLTTATHDMENCAGDWFLLDQEMDKALRFSGYDYSFHVINGGHVAGYYDHYRAAMSCLWKDWPAPVKAGPGSPRARDVLLPDQAWQPLSDVHDAGAPACNAAGEVFFPSIAGNKIFRIDASGKIGEFSADSAGAAAVACGPQGELYSVGAGKVVRYDAAGKGTVLAEGIRARHVLAMPDGALYITGPGDKEQTSAVWRLRDGVKTLVASDLDYASGLACRPDRWLLAVAEGHSKWASSFQINADGSLSNKERFFHLHVADWDDDAGPESMCYAREGQLLIATRTGIQICADDGPTQIILPLPSNPRVRGLCFGGADLQTLYAFTADKVWIRKVKLHGLGAFTPMTPVSPTPL